MTHDSAVRTIVSLVPEIEKKGAEAVLLDHAEAENMPPAQLEKLAQVFNSLRSLDYIDKQANTEARGETIPLVDVPELVVDYISRTKQEKAATPIAARVSSHNPATLDLMSAVRFDAPQIKAAAAPDAPPPRRWAKKDLEALAIEMEIDARIAMEKVAQDLLSKLPKLPDGAIDISAALADARPHCNEETLQRSVTWLKSASVRPITGDAMDTPLTKRAFEMTGECGKLLVEFNYEMASRDLMRKLATSVGDDREAAQETPEDVEREVEEMLRQMNIDPGDNTPTERPTFVTDTTGGGGGDDAGDGDGPPPPPPSTPPAGPSRVSKVLKALGAPIRATGDAVGQAATTAKGHIDRVAGKERMNKDQLNSDVDVEDVRRAIGIRRMIGTDAVLREADPREVLEIYNAIARTNPEIVTNMPALRLLLREAVSYEGLTLDSQKQLTDIRSNSSKSEAQEAENTKRRYTIGGGDKPKSK